jgi:hypothetical protein
MQQKKLCLICLVLFFTTHFPHEGTLQELSSHSVENISCDDFDVLDQNFLDEPAEFNEQPHPLKIFIEDCLLKCLLKCIDLHDWYTQTQKKCITYIKYARTDDV